GGGGVGLGRDLQARDEGDGLLVDARVVGDHQGGELLHLGIGRLRLGELAGVDVDLIRGDDDGRDLRVVDRLRGRGGGKDEQCSCEQRGCFHARWMRAHARAFPAGSYRLPASSFPLPASSRLSTVRTMRSQRAPSKPNTPPRAESMSRSSASRSRARARNSRVRTVATGTPSASEVSRADMSSTSRITKTVRNASGSSSMRFSSTLRTSFRSAASDGGSAVTSATSSARAASARSLKETTFRSRRRLRARMRASLMTIRVSQVDSSASPRKSPSFRYAWT